jgi:Mce-associated membrane protein
VAGSSVALAEPDHVECLLYVNQTTQSPGQPSQVAGSRIRVALELVDDRWLVSELTPL